MPALQSPSHFLNSRLESSVLPNLPFPAAAPVTSQGWQAAQPWLTNCSSELEAALLETNQSSGMKASFSHGALLPFISVLPLMAHLHCAEQFWRSIKPGPDVPLLEPCDHPPHISQPLHSEPASRLTLTLSSWCQNCHSLMPASSLLSGSRWHCSRCHPLIKERGYIYILLSRRKDGPMYMQITYKWISSFHK